VPQNDDEVDAKGKKKTKKEKKVDLDNLKRELEMVSIYSRALFNIFNILSILKYKS